MAWNLDHSELVAEVGEEISELFNSSIIGSGRPSDEEQIAKSDDVASIHPCFSIHSADLCARQLTGDKFSDGRLFGNPCRVAWNREKDMAIDHNGLVFNEN
tara:strand:+ start:263 stop:565 length:303 start_codon:yes stop_codon:yes gene_type:complete